MSCGSAQVKMYEFNNSFTEYLWVYLICIFVQELQINVHIR